MSDWIQPGTCGACEEFEFEGNDRKGYCRRYGCYYWDTDTCDRFSPKPGYEDSSSGGGSGSSGCFLTTACCVWKGLPDDCRELQAMRRVRDEYLKQQPYGAELVRTYYDEAPAIVAAINASPDRDRILSETYDTVCVIADLAEAGKNEEAVIRYLMLFHQLYVLTAGK